MAKQSSNDQYLELISAIKAKSFSPFYLLMGDEPFYTDRIAAAILENAIDPFERDFNQIVMYGADVTAEQVISAARQYPMMGQRLLVVLKEAQMMKKPEDLAIYLNSMQPSTILVVVYSGKSVDKRSSFYKSAQKVGVVFESSKVQDYKVASWIESYIASIGQKISPDAANLMAEFTGNDLQKIALEVDKLRKNLPPDQKEITSSDIEKNVGISKEYSVFELTKAISYRDANKIYRISKFFADSPKRYPIQLTIGLLTSYYLKLWRFHSLHQKSEGRMIDKSSRSISQKTKSEIISHLGINPYFFSEYEEAARNYPIKKVILAISTLKEYDYKSKSNARGDATDGDLLIELISKLIN